MDVNFIDAFTCCVGPVYAGYLARSLPVWMDSLDSLTVVTKPDDRHTIDVCQKYDRLRIVTTDVFTQHGAHFNKGAALCIAYAAMDPVDVVLHFDSDIMPAPDWRRKAEREFKPGSIHGALRYDERGRLIEDLGSWPYGYFQMWHADDDACQFWPMFDPWHPHCGSYDLEFLEKWPNNKWRKLSFKVTHFGEVRRNWFGVGLSPEEQAQAFARMDEVHRVGLRKTRLLARTDGHKRLTVPDFKLKVCFSRRDRQWGREMMRACMTDDPFLVSATLGEVLAGYVRVDINILPEQFRRRVASLRDPSHA